MDSNLRSQLRAWLIQVAERHTVISQQSHIAALDDVKTVAAELSDAQLCVLDNVPGLELNKTPASERVSSLLWKPTEADWDGAVKLYAATGHWSVQFGPDPMLKACRCPKEILQRHDVNLETGERRMIPPKGAAELSEADLGAIDSE
jgi:hypothetical protein